MPKNLTMLAMLPMLLALTACEAEDNNDNGPGGGSGITAGLPTARILRCTTQNGCGEYRYAASALPTAATVDYIREECINDGAGTYTEGEPCNPAGHTFRCVQGNREIAVVSYVIAPNLPANQPLNENCERL